MAAPKTSRPLPTIPTEFGRRVSAELKARGMTIEDFRREVIQDGTHEHARRIARGQSSVDPKTLRRIASAFDWDWDETIQLNKEART